ncbi:hypothetical protein ANANG_G00167200 [Anguilla anguilla]|uniref:Actinodin3 n=1 Tax=Anguilla anguilla TaxID=7936 RepID=A0A9D3M992_ANGAN|nr:hypothetical protein ANANG_G00167200 [Anguilla anguilla]
MISQIALVGALCCLTLQPGFLEASSLRKITQNGAPPPDLGAVSVESDQAHGFLSRPRPKRHIDPKWHRNPPDFQAYYKYYNNIGHIEGLYEIDRIRMLYQQMRHLEHVYGPDASQYQNSLGLLPTKSPGPRPPAPPPPMAQADVVYLCNPTDPQCHPHLVYLPTGAVPVLCDPRYHPACKPKTGRPPPACPARHACPAPLLLHPRPKKSLPPPPPAPIIIKGMEYDCDPYWDPDCLIDHPHGPSKPRPRPTAPTPPTPTPTEAEAKGREEEEEATPVLEPKPLGKDKKPAPFLYDYRRELFDPYLYSKPAPDPE